MKIIEKYQYIQYQINVIRCITEFNFLLYIFCIANVDIFWYNLIKLYELWLKLNLICGVNRNGGTIYTYKEEVVIDCQHVAWWFTFGTQIMICLICALITSVARVFKPSTLPQVTIFPLANFSPSKFEKAHHFSIFLPLELIKFFKRQTRRYNKKLRCFKSAALGTLIDLRNP